MPSDTSCRGFSTSDPPAIMLAKSSSRMDASRTYSPLDGVPPLGCVCGGSCGGSCGAGVSPRLWGCGVSATGSSTGWETQQPI